MTRPFLFRTGFGEAFLLGGAIVFLLLAMLTAHGDGALWMWRIYTALFCLISSLFFAGALACTFFDIMVWRKRRHAPAKPTRDVVVMPVGITFHSQNRAKKFEYTELPVKQYVGPDTPFRTGVVIDPDEDER